MANNKCKGIVPIIAGLLLIAAAVALTAYNIYLQSHANDVMQSILNDVVSALPVSVEEVVDYAPDDNVGSIVSDLDNISAPWENKKAPIVTVNGLDIIGYIEVPSLNVTLPVTSEWSYPLMKKAACRYSGEPLEENLIICAHNYADFFGKIDTLNTGDMIYFVDMNGVRYSYEVSQTELLGKHDVEKLESGYEDWDITIFTCTWSGKSRVTVRAQMILV